MKLDFSKWEPNAKGWIGRSGTILPWRGECPTGIHRCDDCLFFMGHNTAPPAYAGDAIVFCCAAKNEALRLEGTAKGGLQ